MVPSQKFGSVSRVVVLGGNCFLGRGFGLALLYGPLRGLEKCQRQGFEWLGSAGYERGELWAFPRIHFGRPVLRPTGAGEEHEHGVNIKYSKLSHMYLHCDSIP